MSEWRKQHDRKNTQENEEESPQIFAVIESDQSAKFSRRKFLELMATTSAAAAVGMAGCSPKPPSEADDNDTSSPQVVMKYHDEIKSGPGEEYETVKFVDAGDVFPVYGRTPDGDWFFIEISGGDDAWVKAILVETNFSAEEISVVENIPPTPGSPEPSRGNGDDDGDDWGGGFETCTCDSVHYWYPN